MQSLIEDLLDSGVDEETDETKKTTEEADVAGGGETKKTKKTTEGAPKPKKRKTEPNKTEPKKNKTSLTVSTKTKPGPKKGQTNAYQQFAIIQRQRIKQAQPNATLAELSKQIAQEWKTASTAVKEQFKQTATSINNNNGP